MKMALKNLDHRNVGSVMTWTYAQEEGGTKTTMAEVLGLTQDGDYTVVHTYLGDHRMQSEGMVDVQLTKTSMLLAQLLTTLERQGD